MRFKKLGTLALLLTILTGCAGTELAKPSQKALDFRTALMDAGGCRFTADVTADYGARVYAFTLDCDYIVDGEAHLTVTAPENIAGITATVSSDGAAVEFDGAALDFGQMANGYVAPLAAPWLLGNCWTAEYISSAGPDGDLERVTYLQGYNEEELTLDTWLDQTGTPVRCEISWNGSRCLTVDLTNFQLGMS